jgi:hypothetical protein
MVNRVNNYFFYSVDIPEGLIGVGNLKKCVGNEMCRKKIWVVVVVVCLGSINAGL